MRELLTQSHTIAVVGLSPQPHRDSHRVARYLQAHGHHIVPVHPGAAAAGATILGERCHASLGEAARALAAEGRHIDLVNVFRRSEDVPPVVDEAIAIGARGVWLQVGIVHEASAARARAAGLQVVQDRCLMVEHARLGMGQSGP